MTQTPWPNDAAFISDGLRCLSPVVIQSPTTRRIRLRKWFFFFLSTSTKLSTCHSPNRKGLPDHYVSGYDSAIVASVLRSCLAQAINSTANIMRQLRNSINRFPFGPNFHLHNCVASFVHYASSWSVAQARGLEVLMELRGNKLVCRCEGAPMTLGRWIGGFTQLADRPQNKSPNVNTEMVWLLRCEPDGPHRSI